MIDRGSTAASPVPLNALYACLEPLPLLISPSAVHAIATRHRAPDSPQLFTQATAPDAPCGVVVDITNLLCEKMLPAIASLVGRSCGGVPPALLELLLKPFAMAVETLGPAAIDLLAFTLDAVLAAIVAEACVYEASMAITQALLHIPEQDPFELKDTNRFVAHAIRGAHARLRPVLCTLADVPALNRVLVRHEASDLQSLRDMLNTPSQGMGAGTERQSRNAAPGGGATKEGGTQEDARGLPCRLQVGWNGQAVDPKYPSPPIYCGSGADTNQLQPWLNGQPFIREGLQSLLMPILSDLCSTATSGTQRAGCAQKLATATATTGFREQCENRPTLSGAPCSSAKGLADDARLRAACAAGDVNLVKSLATMPQVDPDQADAHGVTPLRAALAEGQVDIALALIATGRVDVNQQRADGTTPLWVACQDKQAAVVDRLLAEPGINANLADSDGMTPLYVSTLEGYTNIAQKLLDPGRNRHNIDASLGDVTGTTPLHVACHEGYAQIVDAIAAHIGGCTTPRSAGGIGSSTARAANFVDDDGNTPLHVAVMTHQPPDLIAVVAGMDSVDCTRRNVAGATAFSVALSEGLVSVALILAESGNIGTCSDDDEATPLWFASQKGHANIVQKLLAVTQINANQPHQVDGTTPAFVACDEGHADVLIVLLAAKGVDFDATDTTGTPPIMIAARGGRLDIVELLAGASTINLDQPDASGVTALREAVCEGRLAIALSLIDTGRINVNQQHADGTTLLWVACHKGHMEIVKRLLSESTLDANLADNKGVTPLNVCAQQGNMDAAELLVACAGIDIDAADSDSTTPFHRACTRGDLKLATVLARAGADTCREDAAGARPLFAAVRNGRVETVRYLLAECPEVSKAAPSLPNSRAGSRCDDSSRHDITLAAISANQVEILKLLFEAGLASVTGTHEDGASSLHAACQNGFADLAEWILTVDGVDVNQTDSRGCSALWLCAQNGHESTAEVLLRTTGAAVDLANKDGATPLHVACSNGHETVARILLRAGAADVNARDASGNTPLHLAAQSGHSPIIAMLADVDGVDLGSANSKGMSPLTVANLSPYKQAVAALVHAFCMTKHLEFMPRSVYPIPAEALDGQGLTTCWVATNHQLLADAENTARARTNRSLDAARPTVCVRVTHFGDAVAQEVANVATAAYLRERSVWEVLEPSDLIVPRWGGELMYMLPLRGLLSVVVTNTADKVSLERRVGLALDVARTLEHCHAADVALCRFSTASFAVTPDWRAQLHDLSAAEVVNQDGTRVDAEDVGAAARSGNAGTSAPDSAKTSDLRWFGYLFWEIMEGVLPAGCEWLHGGRSVKYPYRPQSRPPAMPTALFDFACRCWSHDENSFADAKQLIDALQVIANCEEALSMGGYDPAFFVDAEKLDALDLTCGVCQAVMKAPASGRCGHAFCYYCVSTWLTMRRGCVHQPRPGTCPVCRANMVPDDLNPRAELKATIDDLRVECPRDGCGREYTLRDWRVHMASDHNLAISETELPPRPTQASTTGANSGSGAGGALPPEWTDPYQDHLMDLDEDDMPLDMPPLIAIGPPDLRALQLQMAHQTEVAREYGYSVPPLGQRPSEPASQLARAPPEQNLQDFRITATEQELQPRALAASERVRPRSAVLNATYESSDDDDGDDNHHHEIDTQMDLHRAEHLPPTLAPVQQRQALNAGQPQTHESSEDESDGVPEPQVGVLSPPADAQSSDGDGVPELEIGALHPPSDSQSSDDDDDMPELESGTRNPPADAQSSDGDGVPELEVGALHPPSDSESSDDDDMPELEDATTAYAARRGMPANAAAESDGDDLDMPELEFGPGEEMAFGQVRPLGFNFEQLPVLTQHGGRLGARPHAPRPFARAPVRAAESVANEGGRSHLALALAPNLRSARRLGGEPIGVEGHMRREGAGGGRFDLPVIIPPTLEELEPRATNAQDEHRPRLNLRRPLFVHSPAHVASPVHVLLSSSDPLPAAAVSRTAAAAVSRPLPYPRYLPLDSGDYLSPTSLWALPETPPALAHPRGHAHSDSVSANVSAAAPQLVQPLRLGTHMRRARPRLQHSQPLLRSVNTARSLDRSLITDLLPFSDDEPSQRSQRLIRSVNAARTPDPQSSAVASAVGDLLPAAAAALPRGLSNSFPSNRPGRVVVNNPILPAQQPGRWVHSQEDEFHESSVAFSWPHDAPVRADDGAAPRPMAASHELAQGMSQRIIAAALGGLGGSAEGVAGELEQYTSSNSSQRVQRLQMPRASARAPTRAPHFPVEDASPFERTSISVPLSHGMQGVIAFPDVAAPPADAHSLAQFNPGPPLEDRGLQGRVHIRTDLRAVLHTGMMPAQILHPTTGFDWRRRALDYEPRAGLSSLPSGASEPLRTLINATRVMLSESPDPLRVNRRMMPLSRKYEYVWPFPMLPRTNAEPAGF